MKVNRREFLELSAKFAAAMGLAAIEAPAIAEALEELTKGAAPVLWLQGLSCSGCSVSLLNSEAPTAAELITKHIQLKFHSNLSVATGEVAIKTIDDQIEAGGYVLVTEGSVPAGMPAACRIGHEPFTEQLKRAAGNAKAVLAVGACAAYAGIPGGEGNLTGALSVPDYLKKCGISTPTIRIPGCPAHPDWVVGTVIHVLRYGLPELDEEARPKMFFARLVHEQCPRFRDYESENFAQGFGAEGCYFKIGCLGPITKADCTLRQWNGVNHCIKSGSPCIGCASPKFALRQSFPFFTKG